MESQEFFDMNQVLQKAVIHENHAMDHRLLSRFKECNSNEKRGPN
jgi:hypothetical protein